MHEYSIVEQLIEQLLAEFKEKNVDRVKKIHLRRGSTFAEGPIRQAFEMLSDGTPLKNTELVIDEYEIEHTCKNCDKTHVVKSDDLIGHLFICPDCGKSVEIEEAHALELLEVEV